LVTVRCRRKGHVLAELAATGDGHRVLRMRHHAILHITADGQVGQQPGVPGPGLWHLSDWEARDSAASYPVACACRRVHLVSVADVEAATAAGQPSVAAAPMRSGQRCTMPVVADGGQIPGWLQDLARFGSVP
jgi:hypothetical protein